MPSKSSKDCIYSFYHQASSTNDSRIYFAARNSGLMRSDDNGSTWRNALSSLSLHTMAPITAVIAPGEFEGQRAIMAATAGGFLRSVDDGMSWGSIVLPTPSPTLTCMVSSPEFEKDGTIFSASLEDGVYCSFNGGTGWMAWNFGLTDLSVLSLAVSPSFGQDETLLAGTASGAFCSTNSGRSWREMKLTPDFEAVLSLAFSPNYEQDGGIYAGTENSGVFGTSNFGIDWCRLDQGALGGEISALYLTNEGLLLLHDNQVLVSTDGGKECTAWNYQALNAVEVTMIYASQSDKPVFVGTAGGEVLKFPAW